MIPQVTQFFFPRNSYVAPIFRLFLGTDLQRICNGGGTVLEYRQEKGVNEKNKKFLERVLHLLILCAIFLLIIRALDVV